MVRGRVFEISPMLFQSRGISCEIRQRGRPRGNGAEAECVNERLKLKKKPKERYGPKESDG